MVEVRWKKSSVVLHERALAIRERALGPDHVDLTETLVGLASVRKEQGYNAEVLALYQRALAIKERPFSADHPELEEIRSNIDVLSLTTESSLTVVIASTHRRG